MSDYSFIDALGLVNQDTQYDPNNFKRVGTSVLVSPTVALGTLIPKNSWMGLGYFEEDADIAPTTDVTRSPILVQNPMGGPPITFVEDITDVSAIYETIMPVTTDAAIQALHQGSVPKLLTDPALAGTTISPFTVGASILSRVVVIRVLEGITDAERRFELLFHPRGAVQGGTFGRVEGRTTRIFRIPVRTWNGEFEDDALAPDGISDLGAIWQGPFDELVPLLLRLKLEAAAA